MNLVPILKNRVIAISGWKRSGKDTTADHLVSRYGYQKLSFAAALKDLVARQYLIHRAMLDDQKLKEEPLLQYPVIDSDEFTTAIHRMMADSLSSGYWTPRALCILEGSIKRSVTARYWIQKTIETIKDNPDRKYVISDLRYTSEADTLRMLLPASELLLLRVERHQEIDTNDPSERDLDHYKFDATMFNYQDSIERYLEGVDLYMQFSGVVPLRGPGQ